MKILYIAGRWDPRLQDEFSGNDYGAYHAIQRASDIELKLVGPLDFKPSPLEQLLTRVYLKVSGKRLLKYPINYPGKCEKVIREAIRRVQPDVVFSKYSAPLASLRLSVPLVYMCDSIVAFSESLASEFFPLGYRLMEKWERGVLRQATTILTYSQANADLIVSRYGVGAERLVVLPIPAYVPDEFRPTSLPETGLLESPLKLLFVGKRPKLRGLDIAIETVHQLVAQGIPAELRIVGLEGHSEGPVRFMGVYRKEDPEALRGYFENFQWAHVLLHPSRFHAAGIVISEAACFGVPTITNNVGGLATSVLHEKTGVVLPKNSPASVYSETIKGLMTDQERYQSMRQQTFERFNRELNWDRAGERLVAALRSAGEEVGAERKTEVSIVVG